MVQRAVFQMGQAACFAVERKFKIQGFAPCLFIFIGIQPHIPALADRKTEYLRVIFRTHKHVTCIVGHRHFDISFNALPFGKQRLKRACGRPIRLCAECQCGVDADSIQQNQRRQKHYPFFVAEHLLRFCQRFRQRFRVHFRIGHHDQRRQPQVFFCQPQADAAVLPGHFLPRAACVHINAAGRNGEAKTLFVQQQQPDGDVRLVLPVHADERFVCAGGQCRTEQQKK